MTRFVRSGYRWYYADDAGIQASVDCDEEGWILAADLLPAVSMEVQTSHNGEFTLHNTWTGQKWNYHNDTLTGWQPLTPPMKVKR